MSGWHLAAINRADLEEIMAIERQAFQHPWQRIHFENRMAVDNACHYCAKINNGTAPGALIAYVFMCRFGTELHLLKMAVTASRRRQKIASWLLERCFSRCARQGAQQVLLEVRPSNIPAVGLYRKLGFESVGKRYGYYEDSKEDALVMIKKL